MQYMLSQNKQISNRFPMNFIVLMQSSRWVILCEESIARSFEAWKNYPVPDLSNFRFNIPCFPWIRVNRVILDFVLQNNLPGVIFCRKSIARIAKPQKRFSEITHRNMIFRKESKVAPLISISIGEPSTLYNF